MGDERARPERRVLSRFHPLFYKAIAGLALWFVLAAWGFVGDSRTAYLLAVVSGFFLLAVGLPVALWLTSRSGPVDDTNPQAERRLSRWASSEFETWTGRVRGKLAIVEALLPIAAVAIGMTAFVIALHVALHSH